MKLNSKLKISHLLFFLTIPHWVAYFISKEKDKIIKDLSIWSTPYGKSFEDISLFMKMTYFLLFYKEYRNLFYCRIGGSSKFILYYLPPMSSLYICTETSNIGEGFYLQHGFSTIVNAHSIGINCHINQQVTIGTNTPKIGCPRIGNNVKIHAGAKILGPITIGDNVIIGANAVVVKDIPTNLVVAPSPTIIIKNGNERVNQKL